MKGFLKRRWHGIPIGILSVVLALAVTAGGVLAAYSFLTATITVDVEEAITVLYRWPGDDWVELKDGATLSITDAFPGESVFIPIAVRNDSSASLHVVMTATVPEELSVTGGPDGPIAGGTTWAGKLTASVDGDAPPGIYTVTLNFTRN